MRAARRTLVVLCCMALAYVAYPYVTLYRLGQAIDTGNAKALQAMVDWPSVRQGIKQDICDGPHATTASDELPAFGSSFVRGVTAGAVDRHVTPQGLVAAARRGGGGGGDTATNGADMHVAWAFFDDPTHFVVSLHAGDRPQAIRLELSLRDTGWRVTRVWLPPDMLDEANSRT